MQQGFPATGSCPSFETVGVADWRGVWFGKGQNGGWQEDRSLSNGNCVVNMHSKAA